MKLMSLKWF